MKEKIYTLLFPIAAYIILLTQSDYLIAVADNDMFVSSRTFMEETLSNTGGLWSWLGCFLTQFFATPWLGILIITLIWFVTYICLVDAFKLKGAHKLWAWVPVCALLISVLNIGYWLYYMKMPGYWFSQSLSFMSASVLTWVASKALSMVCKKNISWLLFIIAYFAVCQKFPEFQRQTYSNHTLQLPFIIAPVAVIALPLLKLIKLPFNLKWQSEAISFIALIAFVIAAHTFSFRDYNYHAEIRMLNAMERCDWTTIINEAKKANNPTNLMVVCKNIALMHTDKLTDMFKINNCGVQPNTGDSLTVSLAHIAGPMIYYQFGQLNYAYRWAMENNIEYGLRAKNIKMMARCAIMNHEFDVAAKYLALLGASTVHKAWAKEREPMLRHAKALQESTEYKCISPLMLDDVNMLDIDSSLPEKWLLNHFSDLVRGNTPKLEELIMCTSLWTEDDYAFCIHFYNYWKDHRNQEMPELYQQAALLLGKSEQSPINLDNYPFDQLILSRYETFKNEYSALANMGISNEKIGERLKPTFGDTYWWYYYFYTDFRLY